MKINNIMRLKELKTIGPDGSVDLYQAGKPEGMSQEEWDKHTAPKKLPPGGNPRNIPKELLEPQKVKEEATAGATASGNIASVVNPHVANPSRKSVAYTGTPGVSGKGPVKQYVAKKQKPTDNALDGDALLMSSKEPQMIRRQIKEGSLYKAQLNELWPALIGAAAAGTALYQGGKALGKWMDNQRATPSRTDTAIEKATGSTYAKPKTKKKKKTEEGLRIEPRGEAGKANAFKQAMANVAKNKETRAINTEKSKRQTAQAAGYNAIVGGKDLSQIAKG